MILSEGMILLWSAENIPQLPPYIFVGVLLISQILYLGLLQLQIFSLKWYNSMSLYNPNTPKVLDS